MITWTSNTLHLIHRRGGSRQATTCRTTRARRFLVRVACSSSAPGEAASGRRPLVIATRPSQLAQEQTRQVQRLLLAAAQLRNEPLELSVLPIRTAGDADTTSPLRNLGSGAFTEALDAAVADCRTADMAVHSLKDCPAVLREGLVLAACLPRADPRDVLVVAKEAEEAGGGGGVAGAGSSIKGLADLPPGSRVGTSSSRRAAQIRYLHPHLQVVQLRGNVESRLERIRTGELRATVMALAGLQRMGREDAASAVLSTEEMLPAACQGAVGVVCRDDDPWVRQLLSAISHRSTLLEVAAERA
ncbi:hypothetical protein Agub_g8392, partial [Astrephomene gubernaculifera]